MKNFFLCFLFLSLLKVSPLHARKSLDRLIAPQLGVAFQSENYESEFGTYKTSGLRWLLRSDFMKISDHVSFLGSVGTGLGYIDFGGQLRVFDVSSFRDFGSSGLLYGLGAGWTFSPGFDTSLTGESKRRPFFEVLGSTFLRFQIDFNGSWGVFVEASYEIIPIRSYHTVDRKEPAVKHRFLGSVGIPFEFPEETLF